MPDESLVLALKGMFDKIAESGTSKIRIVIK